MECERRWARGQVRGRGPRSDGEAQSKSSKAGSTIPLWIISSRTIGWVPAQDLAGLGAVEVRALRPRLPVTVAGATAVGVTDCPFDQPLGDIDQVEFPERGRDLLELDAGANLQGRRDSPGR